MKKIALLLVLALVVQLMPANAMNTLAADDTVDTIASDKYYQILDTDGNSYYPFIMESSNIRSDREYTLKSVEVDGIDMTDKFELKTASRAATPDDYEYNSTYVYVAITDGDFLEVSKEHKIKAIITDEYNETFTLETTCIMEPFQDLYEIQVENTEYISTTGVKNTGIKLDDRQFFTKDQSVTVSKVEFADQEGNVYGTVTNGQSYTPYGLYDYRYDNEEIRYNCQDILWTMVGSYTNICQTMFTTYSNLYFREELEEGFYDLIYTLSDGTKYIYKNAYEAVTRPIIYDISDTDSTVESSNAVFTDQTGDYVSVYVYGWNISKDTVKPVFYNEDGDAISGDVKAVETDKWGGYFRIEKNNPNSDDWKIDLSSYEPTNQSGTRMYDVKVETEKELFEESVYITRREIFYQYFDQRDKSYTVYFAQKADVDTAYSPTLSFVKYDYGVQEYVPFATVEGGTFTEKTNELTGQKEIKAKFILTDEQIELIKENEYDFYYSVDYMNTTGEVKNFRNNYASKYAQGGCDVDDVPEKGIFSGYNTSIFYLPYWIGGVYSIEPNDEESYYLTEEDVDALSEGKYAYADFWGDDVSMDETDFNQRSYYYYFMKVGEQPVKPEGKPVLSVEKQDELWRFNWTEVSGANRYYVCLKYQDAEIRVWERADNYFEINPEILTIMYSECFEACRENPDESKMEIYVEAGNKEDGAIVYGDKSKVFTVAGIKNSSSNNNQTQTHTHTTQTQITKAKPGNNGVEKVVCTACKEVLKTTTIHAPKTLTATDLVYNGKEQTPKVVVKDSQGTVINQSNYVVSKVKSVGSNNVTITFANSSKYYAGTMTVTAKVNPKGTSLTTLKGKKKSILVKWKKQRTQTKGYQIQYSTNKKFKSNVKIVTITNNKKTSYTIKKLKAKKKYYIRIRTYKGKCYSVWSKKKSIKTK